MSKAIVVENLSKQYQLTHRSKPKMGQQSLREAMTEGLMRFVRRPEAEARAQESEETFWALRDVSFEVEQGERLAIIGKNGAGKSTLLKILSRVVAPSAGTVRFRGKMSSLLEVGTGFHPELTGRENIYLNGAVLGMSQAEIRKKFDAIVDFAEVERFLDTPVKRYSSGMYVRLAFSVSAFLEPDILVLDEVLSVGDGRFQRKSQRKMRELTAEGRTLLFVSHSMEAVSSICSKALLLEQGSIAAYGAIRDVLNAYEDRSATLRTFGRIELTDWRERTGGNLGVRIAWGEVTLADDANNSGVLYVGGNLRLTFCVHFDPEWVGKSVMLSVVLRTEDGVPIANMISKDSGFFINDVRAEETVSIILHDQRFYPSAYLVGFWVGSPESETWDFVDNCISFNVSPGGSLTQRRLPRDAGLIFLTPSWRRE